MDLSTYHAFAPPIGDSYLVLVEDVMLDGSRFVEAYLLAASPRAPLRSMWIHRPRTGTSQREHMAFVDLHEAALRWAVRLVDADQLQWHANQPIGTPFLTPAQLVARTIAALVILWAEQHFAPQLQAIAAVSRSPKCRAYLHALFEHPPLTMEPTGAEEALAEGSQRTSTQ
jgi:hypothetical protein